ncbi:MAG: siroheme synthase [Proteobacteria bacterium SG_bin5]|nr:siroheme synthase [Sphingomonas sp.]OQW41527.1 MAG: siroheme synthase [Proteobacteria bacterium SG_bin5]
MSLHSLPIFVRLAGREVVLLGAGEAAEAKRRLLERAGAVIVQASASARLAIVAIEDEAEAEAAAAALKARGLLVNVVDRPALCDFTLPAIVDRAPVLVAIGTGGASAGLAAALRQRLEALLPTTLGKLADQLAGARAKLRARFPDPGERRRALGLALSPGGQLDPLGIEADVDFWLDDYVAGPGRDLFVMRLTSPDPDDLTLRRARHLALADRVYHTAAVPSAILDRARADAERILADAPPDNDLPGLSVFVDFAP